ncbi:MAG: sigma-70 family RNA polymerase sigma factor [Prevotella sp.]|nr:sigma-70 family RNA polymerase sigma factor [Prevotella sp.]
MTDRELVHQVLHDNRQQAFAAIVGRYSGMVFSKALGIVKREDAAKDIAQQTFLKAYERLAYWRGEELGPWLVSIAMHTALNELERARRAQRHALAANQPPPDYDAERETMLQRMEQAIDALPEQDQTIIQLHYFQQRKTDEIARVVGLSQSNVLVRLHRIRERLKKMLTT